MSAIPTGYKQTEAGLIPEDWHAMKLGDFVCLQRGHDLTDRDRRRGAVPVMGSAGQNGFHDIAVVKGPGVVVGRSGASFGRAHFCKTDFWPHNTALYVTDFRGNDRLFAFFFLRSLDFSRHNSGGAQQSLNRNFIAPIPVGIPSLPEQEGIAEALSDADALTESLEQLVTKKRHLKQGAIQDLFTGKKRLPGFSGEWAITRLGDLATFHKGKGLPKSALDASGGQLCIHYGELFTRYFETIREIVSRTDSSENSFRSIANDVLMPTSDVTPNGLAKASCIRMSGVILGGDILVIRPMADRVFGSFLSYVIRHAEEQILQLVTGSTVFHLYAADMKKFTLSLPSVAEQQAIVAVLDEQTAEIADLESQLTKIRNIKQGMMHQLLTGRIRLI